MQYTLVSGDSHIDMSWLPGDLFVKNGPAHLEDAMPRVVESTAKVPRVVWGVLSRLDSQMRWAYPWRQDRRGTTTSSLRVEMGNPGYPLLG